MISTRQLYLVFLSFWILSVARAEENGGGGDDGESTTVTALQIQTSSASCSGDFKLSSFSVDCDECKLGQAIGVSGSIVSNHGFPQKTTATIEACVFFGWVCYPIMSGKEVDMCGGKLQAANDDTTCPGAGTYTFDTNFDVPAAGGYENFGSGYTVTLKVHFNEDTGGDDDASSSSYSGSSTTCSVKVDAVNAANSYGMVAFSAFFFGGMMLTACVMYRSRKRRIVTEDEMIGRSFEIMQDLPSRRGKQQSSPRATGTEQLASGALV